MTTTDDLLITIAITREEGCKDLPLPHYQTTGSSGMDLRAAVDAPFILRPGAVALVPTGLRLAIPVGYEGQVRPRSGLALKHGIGVLNSPGTIDSDYRGPVNIILFNFSNNPFTIERGDRIAQLVIAKTEKIIWKEVESIDATERGEGGFGHTGAR